MTKPQTNPRQIVEPLPSSNSRSKQATLPIDTSTTQTKGQRSTTATSKQRSTAPHSSRQSKELQCDRCGKILKSRAAMNYHSAHPSACRKYAMNKLVVTAKIESLTRRKDQPEPKPARHTVPPRPVVSGGRNDFGGSDLRGPIERAPCKRSISRKAQDLWDSTSVRVANKDQPRSATATERATKRRRKSATRIPGKITVHEW